MRDDLLPRLTALYRDLHTHPELSGQEHRTAGVVATWLRELGHDVVEGVGGTGVVGILRNGAGPTVLLRADMDALPVTEATGLAYASTVEGVMHACGHDVHVTCLLGAADRLTAARDTWTGTLLCLFQPAEETVRGARAMVDDGLFTRVPRPDVVLGQHVAPIPAGTLGLRSGPAFAASDALKVTLYGTGGHGSRPEATVDPVVMAAATVMRLQTLVSREVAGTDTAVLTVGALNAGTKANIIPDDAELLLNVRSYDETVRRHLLEAIARVVRAEAEASRAPRPPDIEVFESAPAVLNDPDAVVRTRTALESVTGAGRVVDPGPVTGSEDVGVLAAAAGAPLVYWLLGGADPAAFAGATTTEQLMRVVAGLPSNHSPQFAPVEDPTLALGVEAL
ncbi:MAG TPA: amidohydrolase, partial [Ornithinibacter sp.]|nr:amidohydrolase [Ornithinibacter sp.]